MISTLYRSGSFHLNRYLENVQRIYSTLDYLNAKYSFYRHHTLEINMKILHYSYKALFCYSEKEKRKLHHVICEWLVRQFYQSVTTISQTFCHLLPHYITSVSFMTFYKKPSDVKYKKENEFQ